MNPKGIKRFFASRGGVWDDWIANLSPQEGHVFTAVVQHWETSYGMMSVALDEALTFRSHGRLVLARQQAANSAILMKRLAATLNSALHAVEARARHLGAVPVVEPLKSEFFRSQNAQNSASWNSLLYRVLLNERTRLFHKLHTLLDIMDRLTVEFSTVAKEIAEGTCSHPQGSWMALECLQYDANTCLRETVVLLKSLLRTLPRQQLSAFEEELLAAPPLPSASIRISRSRVPV